MAWMNVLQNYTTHKSANLDQRLASLLLRVLICKLTRVTSMNVIN